MTGVQTCALPICYVTECTAENIFYVKGKRLVTPPPFVGILKGITRDCMMRLGHEAGLEVSEEVFTRHELYAADEVFLTGTGAELIPVIKIDNRQIGEGKPGKTTLALIKAFNKITSKEGVKYSV